MRSTVARRLSTLGSFYRYCHVKGILERNPAANVRRPKVDVESRTLGLDRNELGGLLVQAGLGSAHDHALISLLALNGLRISEALGADIESMGMDRGHRTMAIVRKGGKQGVSDGAHGRFLNEGTLFVRPRYCQRCPQSAAQGHSVSTFDSSCRATTARRTPARHVRVWNLSMP